MPIERSGVICGNAPLEDHLWWSVRDDGHNEGAECGAAVALAVGGYDVPNAGVGILGEIFKRNTMMEVARKLYKGGHYEAAVDIAICSQVHNQPVHDCLQNNRPAIKQWFNEEYV